MTDRAEVWLEDTLDYRFTDVDLFRLALTHRSAAGDNNERLEFLGDAVLDVVISEVLYRLHPLAPEGDLSRLRSSLVNDSVLAKLATELGLGEHLILGSGERKTGGHRRDSILADALEAIFGAVYLDTGFAAASAMIERAFGHRLLEFPDIEDLRDPKTRLQEWLQAHKMALPIYELVGVSGKAHRQTFEVRCSIEEVSTESTGTGTTRRNAEQQAAKQVLHELTAGK